MQCFAYISCLTYVAKKSDIYLDSEIYLDSRFKSSCKVIQQLSCSGERSYFGSVGYFVEGWIVPNDILIHP